MKIESLNTDLSLLRKYSSHALDVREEHLITASLWTRLKELFFHSLAIERQHRLQQYVQSVNAFFESHLNATDQIKSFYTEGLAKWDISLFDRTTLSPTLLERIYPESKPEGGNSIQEALWEIGVAQALGIHPKGNPKGMSGSVIYLDRKKQPIGIFKQDIQSVTARIRYWIAALFGFSCQCHLLGLPQPQAEVAAFQTDTFFNLGIVPLTEQVTINGKTGSFMLWKRDMQEAGETTFNAQPTRNELLLFQRMIVLDYLIGGSDCHLENWLVQQDPNSGTITDLAKIDNGNAFPWRTPTMGIFDYFARRYMYKWKHHPWAQHPLEPAICTLLQSFSVSKIEELLRTIANAITLSSQQQDALRLRATTLHEWANKHAQEAITHLGDRFTRSAQLEIVQDQFQGLIVP